MDKLIEFNSLLVGKNKVVNLTAHKTIEQSLLYNIEDSILFNTDIEAYISKGKIADIGSGGGAPAIPLAISFPNARFTLIDSVNKKVSFLNEAAAYLNLKNMKAIHTRIEDFASKNREGFDAVTARAVSHLSTLIEYSIPLLKHGGVLLAFKGARYEEEIAEAKNAMRELNCAVIDVLAKELETPEGKLERKIVVIKKLGKTAPKYPRGKNLPRTNPL